MERDELRTTLVNHLETLRRNLQVVSMQDYSATGLCALYHVALKKEAVRQVIICQDDAFVVVPVKMLIQKFPQFVPQDRILHYSLEIFPAVKLQRWSVLFRNGQQPPPCSINGFSLTCRI